MHVLRHNALIAVSVGLLMGLIGVVGARFAFAQVCDRLTPESNPCEWGCKSHTQWVWMSGPADWEAWWFSEPAVPPSPYDQYLCTEHKEGNTPATLAWVTVTFYENGAPNCRTTDDGY